MAATTPSLQPRPNRHQLSAAFGDHLIRVGVSLRLDLRERHPERALKRALDLRGREVGARVLSPAEARKKIGLKPRN